MFLARLAATDVQGALCAVEPVPGLLSGGTCAAHVKRTGLVVVFEFHKVHAHAVEEVEGQIGTGDFCLVLVHDVGKAFSPAVGREGTGVAFKIDVDGLVLALCAGAVGCSQEPDPAAAVAFALDDETVLVKVFAWLELGAHEEVRAESFGAFIG